MLTYSECETLMASARNPSQGKPLANNTRLYRRGDSYAVELHSTDVVTIHPDGTRTINTGGWDTNVTWNRIWRFGGFRPTYKRFDYSSGWDGGYRKALVGRPRADDPEPPYVERDIPRGPFYARDPGPEPVHDRSRCIAGTVEEFEAVASHTWYDFSREPIPRMAYNVRPIRSGHEGYYYDIAVVGRIEWSANRWAFGNTKTCPCCKAFHKAHDAWHTAYYGGYGRGSAPGYKLYREMMDRFGTIDAWAEAYAEQSRAIRARNRERIQWARRNAMEVPSRSFRVDSDGYLLDDIVPLPPLPPTPAEAFDEVVDAFTSDVGVPQPVKQEVKGTPIVASGGQRRILRFAGGEAFAVRCRRSKIVRMVSHLYVEDDRDYKWPPVVGAIKKRLQSLGFTVLTVSRATLEKWSHIPAKTHLPIYVMQKASRREYGSAWHRMMLRPHHAGTMRLDRV